MFTLRTLRSEKTPHAYKHTISHEQLDTSSHVPRIQAQYASQALHGRVRWEPVRSLWYFFMLAIVLIWGWPTLGWASFGVFVLSCSVVLCLGHSLGMHRRFVHNSYQCPLWLEYSLVWLGTLVGMAGPMGMMRTHDTRDWAQRQPHCHDFFAHRQSFWRDAWWQLHCELRLDEPPQFQPEPRVASSHFYRFLEATWMAQQLIPAALLYAWGGWGFVVWGVAARVVVSLSGHWLIGHFAHRQGSRSWHVSDAGVQGYNVHLQGVLKPVTALLSFGECWHNNHHAFPGSARLGVYAGQWDPSWWVLGGLQRIGLAWAVRTPEQLPKRESLQAIHADPSSV